MGTLTAPIRDGRVVSEANCVCESGAAIGPSDAVDRPPVAPADPLIIIGDLQERRKNIPFL